MKKASIKMADQNIPELRRNELGKGVRGKYLKHFTQETQGLTARSGRTTRKRIAA